jgi:hypothetical protein
MSDFLSRARTPTSPSPSPEPQEEVSEQKPSEAHNELKSEGGTSFNPAVNTTASSSSTLATGLNPSTQTDLTSASSITLDTSQSSQNQSSEIARQLLEEKIRIGVDDLMQLAMCAGDVQPGDEDIVRMKM